MLPDNWLRDDVFDPGLFGLLENPGVLRLEFDDYPDSVLNHEHDHYDDLAGNAEEEHEDSPEEEEDDMMMDADDERSLIAESFLESTLYLDRVKTIIVLKIKTYKNKLPLLQSLSSGNISDKARDDYFDYVERRFEREPPEYDEALKQNGLEPDYIRSLKIEDPDDSSDNTLKLSDEEDSDNETYV